MNFNNKKMKHNIFSLCLSALLACVTIFSAQAQQDMQTFKGVVVDANDDPVIGASVKVLGTTTGTVTDLDGIFSVQVPVDGKVEISYLGHKTQTISNFSNTRIVLAEDIMQLDDVVVVGYATQKKAHLTGAISTIDPKEISDLSGPSLSTSLIGLIPGLSVTSSDSRPGSSSRLTIRQAEVTTGLSNVSGYVPYTGPLYVIDGFVYPEDQGQSAFNNLDPTMIESISVLKDGAAAVYGVRSANGVILVATKKGQIGKPKISYSGQFGYLDEVSRAKMLNSYNYGKIWNGVRAANPTNTWDAQKDLYQADELEAMRGLDYDLLDKYWSGSFSQKHSVNISGASDNANYYAGISYYTQDGNLGDIDYERWNYRAGLDLKISKWVKASLQVSGDYGEQKKAFNKVGGSNDDTDYNSLLTRPRYIPEYVNGYPVATYGVTNSYINDAQLYNFDVIQNLDNYTQSKPQNMLINTGLEYDFGWSKILKGLTVKFTYSKQISTSEGNEYGTNYNVYSMAQRGGSGGHLYTGDDLNTDPDNFQTIIVDNKNYLSRSMSRTDNYQMNFQVSYNRTFNEHNVSGLFAIEKSETEMEDLSGSVSDPYSFTNGQSNSATGTQTTSFGRTEAGSLSYIGRINYAYNNKYLAEFLIRSDASTKFAPENYWGVFPSFSAGWVISEENWFQNNVKGIDFLKLRGSFALTGKDNVKAWAWVRHYNMDKDKGPIFGTNGYNQSTPTHMSMPDESVNRDARWDKSYKSNLGIDLFTLNHRLNVTLDGYYTWERDLFMVRKAEVPSTVGTTPAAENYGSVDTYGVEASVTWKDKIGKDFKYSVNLNTAYSDNKVLKYPWDSKIPIDEIQRNGREDTGDWGLQCVGMFRSYQEIEEYFATYNITDYLGMSKSDVRPGMLIYKDIRGDQNEDGSYAGPDGKVDTENDLVQMSSRSNPYNLNLNLKAEWRDFSISAQINANWGGYSFISQNARSIRSLTSTASGYDVMQFTNLPSFWANNMFVYEEVLDANGNVVAEANRDAKYPNLNYSMNGYNSTFWRVSGTRVTLRNITMAYSLPKKIVSQVGAESCRFNFTVQNVLSFYNPYPDNFIDPLSGSYGSYPNMRRFTLGVNVSF